MNNQFDSANYPDKIPDELVAGARWAWTYSDATDAYPTASYTLKYRLSFLNDPHSDFEITAGKTGSVHTVEVTTTDTAKYSAGEYAWQAVIVRDSDSEEVVIDQGLVTIAADFGASPGNTASQTYRTLVAIRANIEASAARGEIAKSIAGRSISWRSFTELLELEREYAKRWDAEKAAINRKAGRATGRRVLATMSA